MSKNKDAGPEVLHMLVKPIEQKSRRVFTRAVVAGTVVAGAVIGLSIPMLMGDVTPATQPTTHATTAPATKPAVAATAKPTTAAANIDRLIIQLGGENADERDAAQKQLVDIGPSAIPALRKAAENNDDPEVRIRAAAAIAQMKEHDQDDGTLITLHMKDTSASDVLSEISRQSHAQITSNGAGRIAGIDNRPITVDADRKPFWDVMSDVCGQLNAAPPLDGSGFGTMVLSAADQRNWTQSAHQINGPFWISVAGVYRTRTIDLQGPESIDDQFSVRMIVYPEPKLAVAQISDLMLKEATDNAGHSLLPKALPPAAARVAQLRANASMNRMGRMVESQLSYPENPGSKISLLRGEVGVTIGQDIQQYIVDDVMGTQKVTNPLKNCEVKVTLNKQPSNVDMYRASIQCTREGLSDEQWSAMISRMNAVTMEDADGRQLIPWPYVTPITMSPTTMSMTCIFSRSGSFNAVLRVGAAVPPARAGEPKKLTWNVATSLKAIKVPIEFKNLPMP